MTGPRDPDGGSRPAGEGVDRATEALVGATLGLLAAGGALVVLVAPGAGTDGVVLGYPVANPVRVVAGAGTVAFAASRRGLLDRRIGGAVGALSGGAVLVADFAAMSGAITVWAQPLGLPVAGLLGAVALGAGLADVRGLPDDRVWIVSRGLGSALAFGIAGFLLAVLIGSLFASVVLAWLDSGGTGLLYLATTVGTAVGFVVASLAVVRLTDRDLSFVDLSVPSLRHLGYVVLGIVALLVMNAGASILLSEISAPFAESQVEQAARDVDGEPTFLLWLVPLSWLAIAPGEELFFRNVVQKHLYGYLDRVAAVVAASGVFAAMHLPQYANADPVATVVSLAIVFALALILGLAYERTDNLLVPIAVHGTFNAVAFYSMYLRVTGGAGVG